MKVPMETIFFEKQSNTIIDPMYSILKYLGLITYSKDVFSCVSSLAFRFSVNKRMESSSTFLYNWSENWLATDFIGIDSKMYSAFTDDFTFPLYQKKLLQSIKTNIDEGIPSIVWKDGFVVVYGYDDDNRILFSTDGEKDDSIPYEKLGFSELPMWCVHLFSKDKIFISEKELYLESIFQAVYKWKSHDPSLSEKDYACGSGVYDFMIDGIGKYQENVIQTFHIFFALKKHIHHYFFEIAPKMPELHPVLERVRSHSILLDEINFQKSSHLVPLLKEAKRREAGIYEALEETYQTEFHNRMGSIGLR